MELNDSHMTRGATISATDHIGHNHIGHSNTISATAKNHIGHTENQYRPQLYRPKPYRPQNMFIWRRRDDTSRFRVVRMVNLNVNEAYPVYVSPITAKNKYLNVKKCRFQFRPTYRLI